MNKILLVSAAAGATLLTGCAPAGTTPDVTTTSVTTAPAETGKPRRLAEQPKAQAPVLRGPVDVEAQPYTGIFRDNAEIQTFRVVVDEVWRHCLVNAKGGMACFDSSDAP